MQEDLPGRTYLIGIVGESFYQDAIAALKVGDRVEFRHEPDNPHDQNAVAVVTGGGALIGYVRRETRLQDAVASEGATPTATVSAIGRSVAGHLGVELEVHFGGSVEPEGPLASAATGRGPAPMTPVATIAEEASAPSVFPALAWIGLSVGLIVAIAFFASKISGASSSGAIDEAETRIAAAMRDPSSVQFRDVVICPTGDGVTGYYNAKNSYGAYVGFQAFIYADYRYWLADGSSFGDFNDLMRRCYGPDAAAEAESSIEETDRIMAGTEP